MKKKIGIFILTLAMTCSLTGCASCSRAWTDMKSEFGNGLQRTITVYTADGNIIAQYEGKIDIADAEGGYVKFDWNGKRYMYYNCFVEVIGEK